MVEKPYAVFVLSRLAQSPCFYAGTRRADGSKGLPGGKVDEGESPEDAALRESREEGWEVALLSRKPIHRQEVNGRMIWWFAGVAIQTCPVRVKDWSRGIGPVTLTASEVELSGMGNENLGV